MVQSMVREDARSDIDAAQSQLEVIPPATDSVIQGRMERRSALPQHVLPGILFRLWADEIWKAPFSVEDSRVVRSGMERLRGPSRPGT